MSHEDGRAILARENTAGGGDIVGERREGVLHRTQVITVLLQFRDDTVPARPVDERAVNQHDVAYGAGHRCCGWFGGSRLRSSGCCGLGSVGGRRRGYCGRWGGWRGGGGWFPGARLHGRDIGWF